MDGNSSLTTSGYGGETDYNEEQTGAWILIFQLIFCVLGLLGNLIVMFVIFALKEYKKTVTNWYVLQLTIADFMFLCTIPMKIKETHDDQWPGTVSLCKLNEAIIYLNYYSSILFLTVMSVDRYLIVCRNTSSISQKLRKSSTAYIVTAIVWAVSLTFCTPIFMYANVTRCRCRYEFKMYVTPEDECREIGMVDNMPLCFKLMEIRAESSQNCRNNVSQAHLERIILNEMMTMNIPNISETTQNESSTAEPLSTDYSEYDENAAWTEMDNESQKKEGELPFECSYENDSPAWFAFVRFNFFALFVVPFVIMLICYSLIVKTLIQSGLRKSSLTVASSSNDAISDNRQKLTPSERLYRRTTILCVSYVALFAICWLPFHTLHMLKLSGIHQSRQFCIDISAFSFILVIANSAINPCLYNIIGMKFSRRLRYAVSSLKGKVVSQVESFSSTFAAAAQYRRGNKHESDDSDNVTATTKIYKGKIEVKPSEQTNAADGLRDSDSI